MIYVRSLLFNPNCKDPKTSFQQSKIIIFKEENSFLNRPCFMQNFLYLNLNTGHPMKKSFLLCPHFPRSKRAIKVKVCFSSSGGSGISSGNGW